MKPLLLSQIVFLAVAVLAGILFDRFLLANAGGTPREVAPPTQTAAETTSAAAAATSPDSSAGALLSPTKVPHSDAIAARKSLDAILALREPRARTRDLQNYLNALKPGEFPDALKRVRQIAGSNERELASRLLVANWVQSDPESALQFAAANRGYEYIADDVFQQRAAADFQAALAQAQAIPGNELRYRALRGVLSFMADTDPTGAVQLAPTLGDFRGVEPLSNVIYRQWAATDPRNAALYAAQQGQGNGWRSPVAQVVNTWAEQDPIAAANWSLSLPDADAQARSLAQVMRDWGRQDPTATANWIHSLPAGTQRDAAVAGFAQSMAYADPSTAIGWIGTITDETARVTALQRVSREVMARDPQNGAAILQAAGLPANQIPQPPPRRGRGPAR